MRGRGGIGRRAGLKSRFPIWECGFESHRPHFSLDIYMNPYMKKKEGLTAKDMLFKMLFVSLSKQELRYLVKRLGSCGDQILARVGGKYGKFALISVVIDGLFELDVLDDFFRGFLKIRINYAEEVQSLKDRFELETNTEQSE